MLTGYCSPATRNNRPVLQVRGAACSASVHGSAHPAGQPRNEQVVKLAALAEHELTDLVAVNADRRDLLLGQLAALEDDNSLSPSAAWGAQSTASSAPTGSLVPSSSVTSRRSTASGLSPGRTWPLSVPHSGLFVGFTGMTGLRHRSTAPGTRHAGGRTAHCRQPQAHQ
jgi:hypothetical protein